MEVIFLYDFGNYGLKYTCDENGMLIENYFINQNGCDGDPDLSLDEDDADAGNFTFVAFVYYPDSICMLIFYIYVDNLFNN